VEFLFGGGAVLVLQVICIVHAVRSGRVMPWIFVIIFLPLIGSLIYIVMEILPELSTSRRASAVRSGVRKIADPNRDFRAAKRDVEMVGSADAKKRLAEEYLERGEHDEAIALFESALTGAHADDPALLWGLARARLAKGDGAGTQAALDALQAVNPKLVSADAHLAYARALELQGKDGEALVEYEKLARYFPGEEARVRYALLLKKLGNAEQAGALFEEVLKLTDGGPRHYRQAQKEWSDIARRNL
jgi:hypothetical protein